VRAILPAPPGHPVFVEPPATRGAVIMGDSRHPCVAHARVEGGVLWYYRDSADGLEYLCADAYAQLSDDERLPWRLLPDSAA
jgi:hypothetical protein